MKKFVIMILAVSLCACGANRSQQEQAIKDRQAADALLKEQLEMTPTKLAQDQAKSMTSEGWKVYPDDLPMAKQLEQIYIKRLDVDENGYSKFLFGTGRATGETHTAARLTAQAVATRELASFAQSEIIGVIKEGVGNKQIDDVTASSALEVVGASQNIIAQSLGRVIVVFTAYRELPNHNVEVNMTVAYNSDAARNAAREAIREELGKKSEDLQAKIGALTGF